MKLFAEIIEKEFKNHPIVRGEWNGHIILHIWHIPDPDAKVLIHIAPPTVLVSLAKRPEGSADSEYEAWRHCKPVRLHLGSPDFMGYFLPLVKAWATTPVDISKLTEDGEALEPYLQ
jgi:hypothetical protein